MPDLWVQLWNALARLEVAAHGLARETMTPFIPHQFPPYTEAMAFGITIKRIEQVEQGIRAARQALREKNKDDALARRLISLPHNGTC